MNSTSKDMKIKKLLLTQWQKTTQSLFCCENTLSVNHCSLPRRNRSFWIYLGPRMLFALSLSRFNSDSLSKLWNVISCVCSFMYGTLQSFYNHETPIPYQIRIFTSLGIGLLDIREFHNSKDSSYRTQSYQRINLISSTKITLILCGVFLLKHKHLFSTHGIYTKVYMPYARIFLSKTSPHFVFN